MRTLLYISILVYLIGEKSNACKDFRSFRFSLRHARGLVCGTWSCMSLLSATPCISLCVHAAGNSLVARLFFCKKIGVLRPRADFFLSFFFADATGASCHATRARCQVHEALWLPSSAAGLSIVGWQTVLKSQGCSCTLPLSRMRARTPPPSRGKPDVNRIFKSPLLLFLSC